MCDCILIDNLEVYAHHGLLKEENKLGQKFLISMRLFLSTRAAGVSDDFHKTIDYSEVCSYVTDLTKNHTYKLIEALAENIAGELLLKYDALKEVEVTVKKPWAPIGLPVECVMVTIKRGWHKVYLSLGSNIGDTKSELDYAVGAFKNNDNMRAVRCSSYIVTSPYGEVEQDDFLNAAVELYTLYSPQELLKYVNELEANRNRKREIHWGPRTLDIDIVFYDDAVIREDDLIIPHPDMENRDFVLNPLCEIAPYMVHPIKGMTMMGLKQQLNKNNS